MMKTKNLILVLLVAVIASSCGPSNQSTPSIETSVSSPTPQRLREVEEASVYSFLLNNDPKGYIGDSSTVIILEETQYSAFNEDEKILERLPTLAKETLADYREINQQSQVITATLVLEKPYEILSMAEMNLREKENPAWFNTHTYTVFSRVGFNQSFDQAFVYMEHYCGGECATGNLYLLSRVGDWWGLEKILEGWVS